MTKCHDGGTFDFMEAEMSRDIKPFKTIEEQIAILEDRGLVLDEEEWLRR